MFEWVSFGRSTEPRRATPMEFRSLPQISVRLVAWPLAVSPLRGSFVAAAAAAAAV